LRRARAVPPAARSTFGKGGVSEENFRSTVSRASDRACGLGGSWVADRAHPGGLTAAAPDDDLGRAAADAERPPRFRLPARRSSGRCMTDVTDGCRSPG
jgi:hypothetical protein